MLGIQITNGGQMKHPIQPLEKDANGTLRFKGNAIVRFLLDSGPHDMNTLAMKDFSQEDREQFAQLIGYSLPGFGDLSYVSDETYSAAATMDKNGISEEEARIASLEVVLVKVREGIKIIAPEVFRIHPDDLTA
jgi:hypothetical protein